MCVAFCLLADCELKNCAEHKECAVDLRVEVRLRGSSEWKRGKITAKEGETYNIDVDGRTEEDVPAALIRAVQCVANFNKATEAIYGPPAFYDFDQDGDLDLAVGKQYGGSMQCYHNVGGFRFRRVTDPADCPLRDLKVAKKSALTFVKDVNGDGAQELIVGTEMGLSFFVSNTCRLHCSDNGICRPNEPKDAPRLQCKCLIGFEGFECERCMPGFFGKACKPCPGVGSTTQVNLENICSKRGTCSDGKFGDGTCACVRTPLTPFHGSDCSKGDCGPGTEQVVNTTTKLFQCMQCAAGRHKSTTSAAPCAKCAAGTHCPAGSKVPKACAPGKFSEDAKVACADCKAGRYQSSEGASKCISCIAGETFQSRPGLSHCVAGWLVEGWRRRRT